MGIFFSMLGQLFVKHSSKPLEKMLRDIMELQGNMRLHRAGRVEDDTSKILQSSRFGV